jgi:hypothetical protein
MPADGPQLLALALSLEADEVPGEEAVDALLGAAGHSPTALMGAYAYALCLARDMPYDARNDQTLGLLTRALQRAVRHSADYPGSEGTSLLEHIVEASGMGPLDPSAVASRTAEVQAGLDMLRAGAESDEIHTKHPE